jgi:hypothetical protein
MLSRSLALFAVFSLAAAAACSDSRNGGFLPDGGGPEAGGIKAKGDGGSTTDPEDDGGSAVDSGKKKPPVDSGDPPTTSCTPGSVSGFTPQWTPPTTLHQGTCSPTQVSTLLDCLLNASASKSTCDAFQQAPANKDCQTCAISPSTAASLGPLVVSEDNLLTLNIAGCIARTANQMTSTGCGAKVQSVAQCADAACTANCPVPDGDSKALADRNECQTAAESGACASYQTDADTCSQPLLQGVSAACDNGASFEDLANSIVTLFCGT